MENTYIIEDQIQNYLDYKSWVLLRDILLIGLIYIFYITVEFNVFINALKYYIVFLFIRYIISVTTLYKNKKDDTKYFQISAHLGLFMIIVIFFIQTNTFNLGTNEYIGWLLILSYGLLNIATKKHYSYDILSTILLVYYLFTSDYFNNVLM